MTTIDFSQVLTSLDKEELREPIIGADGKPSDKTRPVTLGRICANAILAPEPATRMPGGAGVEPAEYVKRLKLADLLIGCGEINLAAEEIVLLKRKISEAFAYMPLIAGRALMLLDPQVQIN